MTTFRMPLVCLASLGFLLPATGAFAGETSPGLKRGITIGRIGLDSQNRFGAGVHWDQRDLRKGRANALSVSLVAMTDDVATPVLMRSVSATAKRPDQHYRFALNRSQRRLVRHADGLGVAASQRVDRDGGLYIRAWVARSGDFPKPVRSQGSTLSSGSRCNPVQAGGSYSGCYYGYGDLSSMDLHGATFSDAQFPFTTVAGTNFSGGNLSYAQLGYATMKNANFTNANLTGTYLYGANMLNATVTGATFNLAQYCNTIMPDGSTNNNDC